MKLKTYHTNKIRFNLSIGFFISIGILLLLLFPFISFGQDPSGAATGTINDVAAATAGKPTLEEVGAQAGKNKISINIVWTLITGFLVMFMQAGFALVETGMCRAKNASHTFAMNFMIYPLGMLGYYVCGFAFMFGGLGTLGTLGGYAGLNNEITWTILGKPFGMLGNVGYFLTGP